jgi:hypothetical protein
MSSKLIATRANCAAPQVRIALGQDAGLAIEVTAAPTHSTQATSTATLPVTEALQQQEVTFMTLPAIVAFTPEETMLNSVEVASDATTQHMQPL